LYGVTCVLAIILMLSHALWATLLFVRRDQEKLRDFRKFSLFVWLLWLAPYFTGLIAAMAR